MRTHRFVLTVLALVLLVPRTASVAEVDPLLVCALSLKNIEECDRYISRNPRDAHAYAKRAMNLKGKREFVRALADINKAIEIDPSKANFYNIRAMIFKGKGERDRAIADYSRAIEINGRESLYYEWRADLWVEKGEHNRAIADYTKFLEIDKKNEVIFLKRGELFANKGEHYRAIADCTRAIELDRKYEDAYFVRGKSLEASGKSQQALLDFEKALALNPRNSDAAAKIMEMREKIAVAARGQASPVSSTPIQSAPPPAQAAAAPVQPPSPPAQTSTPPVQASLPATTRVALLIGNGNYENAARLDNPARDVDLLERTLKAAGFAEVVVRKNLDQAGLLRELQAFRPIARRADVAIVYYAGHAIQMNGVNHLIPIDAKLKRDADVDLETVNAAVILSAADGAGRLKVMILDACRDNPFANTMIRTAATRSISRGLARVETTKGEYVAFSTREGSVAADGDGQNSPFAAALAKRIGQKPPLELRRLFDYVRDDVMSATGNNQQPFYYGSLPADLEFHFDR